MDKENKDGKEKEEEQREEFYTVKEFVKDAANFFPFLSFLLQKRDELKSDSKDQEEKRDDENNGIYKEPQIIGKNKHYGQNNGLGSIYFVVKYETDGLLKIIIQKAEELVGKDPRGTSDPYAALSFIPPFRENVYKTMVKIKTLSPVWNHVFVFKNFKESDLRKHSVRITIFDWNKYGTHEDMGEVFYELYKLCPKSQIVRNSKPWSETSSTYNHEFCLEEDDFRNSNYKLTERMKHFPCNKPNNKEESSEDLNSQIIDDWRARFTQDWVYANSASSIIDQESIKDINTEISERDRAIVERSASMIVPSRHRYQYNSPAPSPYYENEYMNEYDDGNVEDEEYGSYESVEASEQNITVIEGESGHTISAADRAKHPGIDEGDMQKSALEGAQNVVRRIEVMKYLSPLPNSRSKFGELHVSLHYDIRLRKMVVNIIKARNMIDQSKRSLVPYCTLTHLLITKDREKNKGVYRTSYRYYTSEPVWNEQFYLKVDPQKIKVTAVEIKIFHSTQASKLNDELLGKIRLGLKSYQKQRAHYTEFLKSIGIPVAQWHDIRH